MAPPENFTEDMTAYPVMVQLVACFEEQLTKRGLPAPCFLGISPGAVVALEGCETCKGGGCGHGFVRLASAFSSTNFPEQDDVGRCGNLTAFVLEVGMVRCFKTMDDFGQAPGMEYMLESTRLQLADMAAMKAAILCCAQTQDLQHSLGTYAPYGPDGNCVGGSWSVTLQQSID